MALKRVSYIDNDGKYKLVLLPESDPDDFAERGIPVGPPPLDELGLPFEIEVKLNNELFHRGILTADDASKRRPEVISALMATLKVNAAKVVDIYIRKGYSNGRKPLKVQSDTTVPDRRRSRTRQRS